MKAWQDQAEKRQEILLAVLDTRVKKQTGFEDGQCDEVHRAVANEYKDSLADMEDCLDELTPELRAEFERTTSERSR